MSYYTAVSHTDREKYGKKIWSCNGFFVYEWQTRLYLYKADYQLSELISGREGLERYYKNDFFKWVESVKKKDLAKAIRIREQAEEALKDADLIEALWGER